MGRKLRCPCCAYVLTLNEYGRNEQRYHECRNFKCDVAFVEVTNEGKIILIFHETGDKYDKRNNR